MLRKGQLNFIKLLKIFMIFCFCVLGSRLFYVQAIQHDKYKGISEGRVNRVEYYAPRRGDIRDIRGNILAMTRDVRTVVMDPGLIALVDPVTQDRFISLLSTLLPLSKEELIEKSRFYRPISGGTWERVTDEHGSPILNSMDLPVYQQITTSEGGLPEICRSGAESESPVPSENAGAHGTVPEGGGTPSESRFRGAQTLRSYEQGVEIRTEITARPACLQPAAFHRPASFRRCGNQDRRKGRRAGMGEMRPRPHAGTQRNRRKAALSRGSPAAVESDRHLRENPHALSAGIRKQGHVAEFRRRAVLLPRNREKSLFSDRAGSGEPRLHDETAAETLPHGARLPMEMPGIPFGFRIQ